MKTLHNNYCNSKQGYLPLFLSDYLDLLDPVLTFDRLMGRIDLNKYLTDIPEYTTGRLRYNPVNMLKTVLFGFMTSGYCSLRELEDNCKVNIRFMYLMDHQTPSYRTFGYFINEILQDKIENIFNDINHATCVQIWCEEKVLNKIQKAGNAERIRKKKKKSSALKKAENRQNEIDRLFAKMYEDRACEKITERNFIMLSGKYQKEQIELEQQITNLREELSKMEQDMIGAEKWIELIKEYSVPKELTAPLLNAMIEKILIHEATTNEDNERIQEIEIYYRFIGKVD